jgi:hypothetical protein
VTGSGCPSCGVAVVPGYVKCPRCHAVLPSAGRLRRGAVDPGGTSVEGRPFPLLPIAGGGIAVAVVLVLVLGGDHRKKAATAAEAGGAASALAQPAAGAAAAAAPGTAAPAAAPGTAAPAPRPLDIPAAAGPTPAIAAAALERALGRQRLWSSVEPSGNRIDVRSGSCAEPAMGPTIDAAQAALRGAGLTRLRCLAQSGAVVFERDL